MKFNVTKCSILYSYLNTTTKVYFHILCMVGELLSTVDQNPYLGIQLDHHLSWRPQVNYVCSIATRYYVVTSEIALKIKLQAICLASTRIHLNNLGPVAIYHQNDISKIEMIQHRAARFVLSHPWRRNNVSDSISSMLH